MVTKQELRTVGIVHDAVVQDFRATQRGDVLVPGDDGYDAARTIWNGMIDKRPALIARCRGVADVIGAVSFAREHRLPLAVRGGGHNVAGNAVCDGGLMLDLSPMKGIHIDPIHRVACVEAGVLWREFDREAQAFGLATTGGTISATGVAGLTLGGGVGWLAAKHGLACDNLRSVDIVTADGQLLRASTTEHADLFWALRGAGANFGVVTSFEFDLHPVGPMIYGGLLLHSIDQAAEVLRFYRDFAARQPDELTTYAAILSMPDGNQAVALVTCYSGELAEGEHILAPLKRFGTPLADTIDPMPYVALQSMLDGAFPYGRQNYWKSSFVEALTDGAIESIVAYTRSMPSPHSVILIQDVHGVASRVPNDATAFAHRDAPHSIAILSNWENQSDTERNIGWTRTFFDDLQEHVMVHAYVNELGHDESAERIQAAYGTNYERLTRIKATYDPGNLFQLNQNIQPAR